MKPTEIQSRRGRPLLSEHRGVENQRHSPRRKNINIVSAETVPSTDDQYNKRCLEREGVYGSAEVTDSSCHFED